MNKTRNNSKTNKNRNQLNNPKGNSIHRVVNVIQMKAARADRTSNSNRMIRLEKKTLDILFRFINN